MENSTYFITGANGFIGSALARELSRQGKKLTLFLHQSDDHPFLEGISGTRIRGDILSPESYRDHLNPRTLVIHAAAFVSFLRSDHERVLLVNREGTRRIVNACIEEGVESLVFLSAGAVWGSTASPQDTITEEDPIGAGEEDAYAWSKVEGEAICREAVGKGLRTVIVNPATVYGTGDYHLRAGGRVVNEICRRPGGFAPPGGTSWLDIRDAVRGILQVDERGREGERYILSAGNILYSDLFRLINRKCGKDRKVRAIPQALKFPLIMAARILEGASGLLRRPSPISTSQIEESFRFKFFLAGKARRELGFSPMVPLSQSVDETIVFEEEFINRQIHTS